MEEKLPVREKFMFVFLYTEKTGRFNRIASSISFNQERSEQAIRDMQDDPTKQVITEIFKMRRTDLARIKR